MLRILAIVTGLGALAWSGWWWAGSTAIERGLAAGIAAARAEGWTIEWDDVSVSGFPNRFDTTVAAPVVAPPDGAWRWEAPFVQVFALSYRPNHVIAVAPPEQMVEGRFGTLRATEDDLRASVVVDPGPALALDRATVAGRGLAFALDGARLAIDAAQVAVRRAEGATATYDLALDLDGIDLSGLTPAGATDRPARGSASVTGAATATLLRPLDRRPDGPQGVERVEIDGLSLDWGDVGLDVEGVLAADAGGLAEGALTLAIRDVDAALALLDGVIPEGQRRLARAFLSEDGTGGRVDLKVSGGVVRLGPLPLATLPALIPG